MPTFSWSVVSSATAASETAETEGAGAETLPRDLELGADGDLLVQGNDLKLNQGQTAIEQDLASRLRAVRGEWFLDTTRGLPYFEDVFVKPSNLNAFRAELRSAAEETPGILEVTSLELLFERASRLLSVTCSARTDLGDLGVSSLNLLEI